MLPKYKLSRSRTRSRRAHHFLRAANYMDCPRCNESKLTHAACGKCGFVRPGLSLKVQKES